MEVQLRDPKIVMKLPKLGSFHQSKLSFLRSFLKEFNDWKYKRDLFELDENGHGRAVYSLTKNNRTYSLVCFANQISDEERSDRVIATKWDAAFALHDGIPTKKDLDRLNQNVPKQEVGRLSYKELTLSRANKSLRIFNYVVNSSTEIFTTYEGVVLIEEGEYTEEVLVTESDIYITGLNANSWHTVSIY